MRILALVLIGFVSLSFSNKVKKSTFLAQEFEAAEEYEGAPDLVYDEEPFTQETGLISSLKEAAKALSVPLPGTFNSMVFRV